MIARTVLATLPGSAPCQRLEVALVQGRDGRLAVDLRQQHYAEGIGWFDQRAMEIDPKQLQQLHALLGTHSTRLEAAVEAAPVSIPFPGPRTAGPLRAAVGEG